MSAMEKLLAEQRWERDPQGLAASLFDVLIIGGGINGAGIARDLALRGLKVALTEKGDFASGTSSASTKLVHGGIRYLENRNFKLVFEACRERKTLQTIAPHLVQPLPFFIPVYRDDPRPLWMVRAGMLLYDLLALFRNTHHHSILSPLEALRREPALRPEGLTGVALYWDCGMDDARLCLENVIAAHLAGAAVCPQLQAVELLKNAGRITGARFRDLEQQSEIEIRAKVVINATGPWLDEICALDGETRKKLRPTRGTHILVPRINRGDEALYLTAGRDDRLFFVVPWGEQSLIGTTDVDFPDAPDRVTPTREDIDYLLAESSRHLHEVSPEKTDIIAAFSGLRPLIYEQQLQASKISREHQIYQSPSGLLSVGGGKYTTYRSLAEELADRVCRLLGKGRLPSRTASQPLPGGATGKLPAFLKQQLPRLQGDWGWSAEQARQLLCRYGSRIELLLALLRQQPELAHSLSASPLLLAGEVIFAARYEFARTPEDILRRRTPLALAPGRGLAQLEKVAELLATELQAGKNRLDCWYTQYRERYSTI
jgi:glycerol-3-phosphate dehydrogenase